MELWVGQDGADPEDKVSGMVRKQKRQGPWRGVDQDRPDPVDKASGIGRKQE